MDPNAAFDFMTSALDAGDLAKAKDHAEDLRTWLAGGGFAPDRPDARGIIADVLNA